MGKIRIVFFLVFFVFLISVGGGERGRRGRETADRGEDIEGALEVAIRLSKLENKE